MGSMRRRALAGGALLAGLLAGCGAGDSGLFADFFGSGTSPGSTYAVQQPGRVEGVIVQRNRDNRILILANLAAATEPVTPVAGVTVSIVELGLTGVTGATGGYLFTEVQPGDLTLRIALPASLGGAVADFRFRLAPGQTLAGLPAGANL